MMIIVQRIIVLLIALLCSGAWTAELHARGGGGCVEQGTQVLSPAGPVPIERLKPGDTVLGVDRQMILPVTVRSLMEVRPEEYIELSVNGRLLRVTAEHPIETAPGVFRTASSLKRGDPVMLHEGGRCVTASITSSKRVLSSTPAYNLLVSPAGTYLANSVVVHNKGCFLPDTPVRTADGTELPISEVRQGDRLLAFTTDGRVVAATVRQVLTHDVDEYRIVRTGSMVLQITPEHPFYVGDGTFKTLEALRPGDMVYAYDGHGLSAQRIESIEAVAAPVRVYNLMTDAPHTFFANGIAVHNKGGGGGCFRVGTPVLTPRGEVPIEQVLPGDTVIAVDEHGQQVPSLVRSTHATRSPHLVIRTTQGDLTTTTEHPLARASGSFLQAGELVPGDAILKWKDGHSTPAYVTGIELLAVDAMVYNLTVEGPHTFIAGGFVVHNKGGGGGYRSSGSRSSSGGRSSSSGGDDAFGAFLAFLTIGTIVIAVVIAVRKSKSENLDQLFSRGDIEKKSEKTKKLLTFIAQQDSTVLPETLKKTVESTFRKLQQCWQAREYEPMKPLLMPDLYADHLGQIHGMARNHEINVISGLQVDSADLVNVRYTLRKEDREFTALITATATDFYIDDRTNERLRGDQEPAQFQEFWTFQYYKDTWLLREIEQTAESDILNDDNFFEQFTDKGVEQVAGAAAKKEGPEGPWLEGAVMTKERRVERMINFLAKTDRIWDRKKMMLTGRSMFLSLTGAWEAGDPAAVPAADLFPELARDLHEAIKKNRDKGVTLEFRNLAVRKVELVLVRNFADNSQDEYMARIRAHAQKVMKVAGSVIRQDEDVAAYEQFLTFGRLDGRWKLKEVVLPHEAEGVVEQENVDQEASKQQIEWYYQHKRVV
ncbi:MAG: polymorphic toxin-type HINT domain-containing protein [Nitrospirota bacterium]